VILSAAAQADSPLIVGRYALFDVLASGGMATVHIGRLLGREGFGRTVAVKRLHTQFTNDPEFVTMFMDEARIVSRIRHPNVVPMVDVIETPQSGGKAGLFLVMEYVHGETFSRLLRAARNAQQPVPIKIIASIMHGALLGLHSAHETRDSNGQPIGIVHRDVSPQNIIVGSDGISRVLDFGVAKAAGRAQVTREGQIKGKLAYMSPEQIRGSVDRRADIFAVAVCLWEALTGRRLHEGARDVDIVLRVMQGSFAKPSELRPDVPRALDEIIMRGLAADPAKRYDNARDMALEIERKVGLAPASEVGPWVEQFAADALRIRSERIGAMEQAAVTMTPAHSAPPPPTAPASEPSARTGPFQMPALASDIASSGGTPMGTEVPVPEKKKGHGAIIALSFFMTLALIGGVLMFLALSRGAAPPVEPAASSATTPLSAGTPAPIVPTSPSSVTVAPIVSAARSAAPSASVAPVVAPRPTYWSPPAPTASQKKKCDPYTIDAQGHRKYNLECIDNQ
jgi:serine/threonine-protein kinase